MVGILRGVLSLASLLGLVLVGTLAVLRLEPSTAYLPMFQKSNDLPGIQASEFTLNLLTPAGKLYHRIYEGETRLRSILVSPDERWLYLYDGGLSLTRIRTDFSEHQYLPYTPGLFSLDCFSPDGQSLVFEHRITTYGNLYSMQVDGSDTQQLTSSPEADYCETWTPDGEWIIYSYHYTGEEGWNSGIYKIRPDGTDKLNLTTNSGVDMFGALSPDGQWVIFRTDREGNSEIFRVRIDGTDMENLTNHPAEDGIGFLSSHGQWIYFSSERSGSRHLYRMHFDGSALERLSEHMSTDYGIAMSPDGCWVVFMNNGRLYRMRTDGSQLKLILDKIDPTTDPAFSPDSRTYYFSARARDIGYSQFRVQLQNGRLEQIGNKGQVAGFLHVAGLYWQSTYPFIGWGAALSGCTPWLIRRHRNA